MNLTKKAEIDAAARSTPVHYFVFDILEADGASVMGRGYDDRRELLLATVHARGRTQVPPAFDGDVTAAVRTSRELGLEGIMAKRRDSTYLAGKRGRSWVKVKHHLTQEVVIGGWRPGSGNRSGRVGSLLMGIPHGDGLRYVGRVGTGFSDRDLDALAPKFRSLERVTSPFDELPALDAKDAHFIRPSLVGEVEFAEWTPTDKLRQPSWRGWRTDKRAADVVRENE